MKIACLLVFSVHFSGNLLAQSDFTPDLYPVLIQSPGFKAVNNQVQQIEVPEINFSGFDNLDTGTSGIGLK